MAEGKKNLPGIATPDMRRGLRAYFADVISEMKKVVWPTRRDTFRLTGLVLTVCVIFVIYLYVWGTMVEYIIKFLLKGRV